MSYVFYNRALLPEVNESVLSQYPYFFITKNYTTGSYSYYLCDNKVFVLPQSNDYSIRASANLNYITGFYENGTFTLDESNVRSKTIREEFLYGSESYLNGNPIIHWSNFDVPYTSATSSLVYVYATEPEPRYKVHERELKAIADSIRTKTGHTGTITVEEMPSAIDYIETGITPTGTIEITENGTHDVSNYATAEVNVDVEPNLQEKTVTKNGDVIPDTNYDGLSKVTVNVQPTLQNKEITENGTYNADNGFDGLGTVTVNVASSGGSGGDLDALIDGSITEVVSNAKMVCDYKFTSHAKLTSANLPIATSIGATAFSYCTQLKSVNFPSVTSIGAGAFRECSILSSVNFPVATSILAQGFERCRALAEVIFPCVTSVALNAFNTCQALVSADFPNLTSIANQGFAYCSQLKALILRSTTICSISSTNVFTATPIASGAGYIYVPRTLLDTYKSATNWVTFANQFRALEDYTVDGTITGALDETKI